MSHALSLSPNPPFSWARSSAISATLAFHAAVFVLLLAPPVLRQLTPVLPAAPITVLVQEPTPPPKPLPVLDPPKPPARPRVAHKIPLAPPQRPQDILVTDASPQVSEPPPGEPAGPLTEAAAADTAPTPLGYATRHPVPYPALAKRRGEQGTVLLRVLIGSDGAPQRIEIERSSGSVLLDRAAREAVLKWRFTPGTKNGAPYAAWGLVPIEFRLDAG